MNIRGVQKMIDLAKKMKNLNVFIHVSTAYANCDCTRCYDCYHLKQGVLAAIVFPLIKFPEDNLYTFCPGETNYTDTIKGLVQ